MAASEPTQDQDRRDAEGNAGLGPSSSQKGSGLGDEKPTAILVIGNPSAHSNIFSCSQVEDLTVVKDLQTTHSPLTMSSLIWAGKQWQSEHWMLSPSAHDPQYFVGLENVKNMVSSAGMAGSGKTTLLQRISAHLSSSQGASYILNLDPAVIDVPYGANIDIRDTVSSHKLDIWSHDMPDVWGTVKYTTTCSIVHPLLCCAEVLARILTPIAVLLEHQLCALRRAMPLPMANGYFTAAVLLAGELQECDEAIQSGA